VPVGVLLALSTRSCRNPDRGVMLLLSSPDAGESVSSLSRCTAPWLFGTRSDLAPPRLAIGVAIVGVWCCGVGVRDATFGVSGGLFIPLATVGIVGGRVLAVDGFSNGILVVIMGANLEPNPGFIGRRVAATFWSRIRRGWRSDVE